MVGLRGPLFGRAMVFFGTVCVFPDALLVRFLAEGGAQPYCILAWKSFFKLVMIGSHVVRDAGGPRAWLAGLKHGRAYLAAGTLVFALCDVGNNLSLTFTSAANALLFVSMNPPWASLLGLAVLRERLPAKTWACLAVSIVSAALIAMPLFMGQEDENEDEVAKTSVLGDAMGLATGFLLALYVTILRLASKNSPDCDTAAAPTLAYAFGTLLAIALAGGKVFPSAGGWNPDRPQWQFWAGVFLDALSCVVYDFCTTIGAEYISGAEVGLIQLMEVVGGSFCVFLFYGDVPGVWTLVGGGLLLAALWIHEALGMWSYRQERARLLREAELKVIDFDLQPAFVFDESAVSERGANEEPRRASLSSAGTLGTRAATPGGGGARAGTPGRSAYRATATAGLQSLRRASRTSSAASSAPAASLPAPGAEDFAAVMPVPAAPAAPAVACEPGVEPAAGEEDLSPQACLGCLLALLGLRGTAGTGPPHHPRQGEENKPRRRAPDAAEDAPGEAKEKSDRLELEAGTGEVQGTAT